MKRLFSPKEVAALVGISYRQIQYWDSSGFIRPSVRRRGRFRAYSFSDLILLRVARDLRARGLSIQRLRRVIASLQRLVARKQEDLEHLTFLIEGEHILVFTGDVVMDRSSADQYFEFRVQELLAEVRASLSAGDDVEGARDQAV